MRTRSKKASAFLKHAISLLASAVLKAKSAAVGDKTRAILKARMAMTSLVMERKRKGLQLQLASVCDKINTVFGGSSHSDNLAMVLYNPDHRRGTAEACCCSCCCTTCCQNDDGSWRLQKQAVQPGLVEYNMSNEDEQCCPYYSVDDDQRKCPADLALHLEEEALDEDHGGGCSSSSSSIVDYHHDLVRIKSNKEGDDYDHRHEDDENIDDVADMFIVKFHKQMRLQKLESFKRYQDMLQRSL